MASAQLLPALPKGFSYKKPPIDKGITILTFLYFISSIIFLIVFFMNN